MAPKENLKNVNLRRIPFFEFPLVFWFATSLLQRGQFLESLSGQTHPDQKNTGAVGSPTLPCFEKRESNYESLIPCFKLCPQTHMALELEEQGQSPCLPGMPNLTVLTLTAPTERQSSQPESLICHHYGISSPRAEPQLW